MGLFKTKNLQVLLEDTPVSYYWVGFLLADGCFSTNQVSSRIHLGLSYKDLSHVLAFQQYVESSNVIGTEERSGNFGSFGFANISVSQGTVVSDLMSKFGIKFNKTYNPPNLPEIHEVSLLSSLLIGYIDGDGCISHQTGRKDCCIKIKVHSCWSDFITTSFGLFYKLLDVRMPEVRINSKGYCTFAISNSIVVKYLKSKILELNLPILSRKWDKIDLNYKSRVEIATHRDLEIKSLLEAGYRNRDIAKKLGISPSTITMAVKRNTRGGF